MDNTDYKKLAKLAKKLGFVEWDMRRPLNRGHKSYITKLNNKFSDLFASPTDYIALPIKKQEKKILEKNYYANKKKVFVAKTTAYNEATIRRSPRNDWIFNLFGVPYIWKYNDHGAKMEAVFILSPLDLLNNLEKFKHLDIDIYKHTQKRYAWAFMFKNCNSFNTANAYLFDALAYLQEMARGRHWHKDTPEHERQALISQVSLVLKRI